VLWFAERPDWDAVEEVLRDRLVGRFPVFCRRAPEVDRTWVWEDDPEFSLERHVRKITLDEPGTLDQARGSGLSRARWRRR
jgi:diacylglycerol O-acyltransferase